MRRLTANEFLMLEQLRRIGVDDAWRRRLERRYAAAGAATAGSAIPRARRLVPASPHNRRGAPDAAMGRA